MKQALKTKITKQKIYDAFVKIITDEGFYSLGINRIAKVAGIAKPLIYKHYGGLEGLMKEYLKKGDLWPIYSAERSNELKDITPDNRAEIFTSRVVDSLRELRKRKHLKELIKWELSEVNEVTMASTKARNDALIHSHTQIKGLESIDVSAITTIVVNGMLLTALMEDKRKKFIDIDLNTQEGWQRIEDAIQFIYEAIDLKIKEDFNQ